MYYTCALIITHLLGYELFGFDLAKVGMKEMGDLTRPPVNIMI